MERAKSTAKSHCKSQKLKCKPGRVVRTCISLTQRGGERRTRSSRLASPYLAKVRQARDTRKSFSIHTRNLNLKKKKKFLRRKVTHTCQRTVGVGEWRGFQRSHGLGGSDVPEPPRVSLPHYTSRCNNSQRPRGGAKVVAPQRTVRAT